LSLEKSYRFTATGKPRIGTVPDDEQAYERIITFRFDSSSKIRDERLGPLLALAQQRDPTHFGIKTGTTWRDIARYDLMRLNNWERIYA